MKYLSNFNSLEFGGKFYDHGEEIAVAKGEEAAIGNLVREGRVTEIGDSDPEVPAGSEAGEAPEAPSDDRPALSGMTKHELMAQADKEGVAIETDDNKADIIRKIEAARK